MSGWVRPVHAGWVVTGAVPGPDVDEFAGPEEVGAALAAPGAAPGTGLLAVQHPHRTPHAVAAGRSLAEVLPWARAALAQLRRTAYRPVRDVVAPYRVRGESEAAVGVLCLVDPGAVGGDGLARVRPGEQVYPQVVAERAEVLAGLRTATSAAMLVPVGGGETLTALLRRVLASLGAPAVSTVDSGGRRHELWLCGPGPDQDALLAAVAAGPLLVADGNHRVAAAAAAGVDLLALVTGGPRLRIGAIHRAVIGTGMTPAGFRAAWRAAGLPVTELAPGPAAPVAAGTVLLCTAGGAVRVGLPAARPGEPLPRIDHAVVERVLLAGALGLDPAGEHVRAVPEGRAVPECADGLLRLAPVPYADVLAVHRQGRMMPRKSTYFLPKPRSGLLLAGLDGG